MDVTMIALLVLALLQGNAAPSGSIRGEVLQGKPGSEERLPNAQVILNGRGLPIIIRSDSAGQFRFDNLVAGLYCAF